MLLGKPFLPLPRSEFCAFAPLSHCEAAKELALFELGRGEVRMGKIGGVQIVLSPKM